MSQPSDEGLTEVLVKLAQLEKEVSMIDREMRSTADLADELQDSLESLQSNLAQIKWIAVGAGSVLLVKNFGFSVVIQKLLGLSL